VTCRFRGTFTEVNARRPWLVLGPPGKTRHCEPGSVRRCGLESMTDGFYKRYCADTVKK